MLTTARQRRMDSGGLAFLHVSVVSPVLLFTNVIHDRWLTIVLTGPECRCRGTNGWRYRHRRRRQGTAGRGWLSGAAAVTVPLSSGLTGGGFTVGVSTGPRNQWRRGQLVLTMSSGPAVDITEHPASRTSARADAAPTSPDGKSSLPGRCSRRRPHGDCCREAVHCILGPEVLMSEPVGRSSSLPLRLGTNERYEGSWRRRSTSAR